MMKRVDFSSALKVVEAIGAFLTALAILVIMGFFIGVAIADAAPKENLKRVYMKSYLCYFWDNKRKKEFIVYDKGDRRGVTALLNMLLLHPEIRFCGEIINRERFASLEDCREWVRNYNDEFKRRHENERGYLLYQACILE